MASKMVEADQGSLRALVGMIIDWSCCKKEGYFDDVSTTTASLPISQLIRFNSMQFMDIYIQINNKGQS